MKRVVAALAFIATVAGALGAQAQSSMPRANLQSQINSNIVPNASGLITANKLSGVLNNMSASMATQQDSNVFSSSQFFVQNPILESCNGYVFGNGAGPTSCPSFIPHSSVSGLGGAALLNVGTATSTVAAGDDSRIVGAAQKGANLSDLASQSSARTNLGLGGAAVLSVGATAGTVAAGDDSRITGAAQKSNNLSDLLSAATARTNLGVTATGADTTYSYRSNNLSDLASAPAALNTLSGLPHFPTVASLASLSTVTYAAVHIDGYNVAGDLGGGDFAPLLVNGVKVACPLGSGVGDAGSQFQSADSLCWQRAMRGGPDPHMWGAYGDIVEINNTAITTTSGSGAITVPAANFASTDCNVTHGNGCTGSSDKLITITQAQGGTLPTLASYQGAIVGWTDAHNITVSPNVGFTSAFNQYVRYGHADDTALTAFDTYVHSISPTGGTFTTVSFGPGGYGITQPFVVWGGNDYVGAHLTALSSANFTPSNAMVYVTHASSMFRSCEIDSNFLPVNGYLNTVNGTTNLHNCQTRYWLGKFSSVSVTATAPNASALYTVGSMSAGMVPGLVSRGNASAGVPDYSLVVEVESAPYFSVVDGGGSADYGQTAYAGAASGVLTTTAGNCSPNIQINVHQTGGTIDSTPITLANSPVCTTWPTSSSTWTVASGFSQGTGAQFRTNTTCWGSECFVVDSLSTQSVSGALNFDYDSSGIVTYGAGAGTHLFNVQSQQFPNGGPALPSAGGPGGIGATTADDFGYGWWHQGTQSDAVRAIFDGGGMAGIFLDSTSNSIILNQTHIYPVASGAGLSGSRGIVMASGASKTRYDGGNLRGVIEEFVLTNEPNDKPTLTTAKLTNDGTGNANAIFAPGTPPSLIQITTNQKNVYLSNDVLDGLAYMSSSTNNQVALGGISPTGTIGACGTDYSYSLFTCDTIATLDGQNHVHLGEEVGYFNGINLEGSALANFVSDTKFYNSSVTLTQDGSGNPTADCGRLIQISQGSSSFTDYLPATGVKDGCKIEFFALGTGTISLAPITASSPTPTATINGSAAAINIVNGYTETCRLGHITSATQPVALWDCGNSSVSGGGSIGLNIVASSLTLNSNVSGANIFNTTAYGGLLNIGRGNPTITDTASSGTVAEGSGNLFSGPVFAASNATTITNPSTIECRSAPSAGTNVTLTNAWCLYVEDPAKFISQFVVATTSQTITLTASGAGAANLKTLGSGKVTITSASQGNIDGMDFGNTTGGAVHATSLYLGGHAFPTSATAGDVDTLSANGIPTDSGVLLSALATLASPTFTGTPAAPTALAATNTTQLATTAFVQTAIGGAMGGSVTAAGDATGATTALTVFKENGHLFPTTSTGGDVATMNSTTGMYQDSGTLLSALATLASPALTGTPTAPTQTTSDTSTDIATDAFVHNAIASGATIGGAALTLANALTTSGAATTLAFGATGRTYTFPNISATMAVLSGQTFTGAQKYSGDIWIGTGGGLWASGTAPTVSGTGLGTSPSITANGTAAMDITVGSSPSAASFTITFPSAAADGWSCSGSDVTSHSTTIFLLRQIGGGTTTTAVMELFSTADAAAAPNASDNIHLVCGGY